MKHILIVLLGFTIAGIGLTTAAPPIQDGFELWLTAETGVTTNGAGLVSAWSDQSGTGNHVSQTGADSLKPLYVPNQLNGLPILQFDGANDYLNNTVANIVASGQARSVFIVGDADGKPGTQPTGVGGALFFFRRGGGTVMGLNHMDNLQSTHFIHTDGVSFNHTTTPTQDAVISNPFLATYRSVGAGLPGNLTSWLNGNSLNLSATPLLAELGTTTGFTVGNREDQAVTFSPWNGKIAEILVYDHALNAAERIVTENHLTSKWNLPMGANDFYAGDTAGNGQYDFRVLGVGRVDSSNQVLTNSTASGLVLRTPSLGNNEWVLAGDKTAVNALTTSNTIEGTRWERVWQLDKTGNPTDTFTLAFDFSDAGLAPPTPGKLVLLYASNNAFETTDVDFSILSSSYTINGDQVSFNVGGTSLLDGYYTLGTLIPEPSTALLFALGGLLV